MLIADIVRRNAWCFADDDAVVEVDGGRWSWSELARAVVEAGERLRGRTRSRGGRPRRHPRPELPHLPGLLLRLLQVGRGRRAAQHPADAGRAGGVPGLRGAEGAARPRQPRSPGAASSARPSAAIEHVVGFGGDHGFPLDLDDLVAGAPTDDPARGLDATTVYMLAATSGTTGVSKAAVLTNGNALAAIACYAAELPTSERETVLQNIPLFFNPGGPAGLHPALTKGGRTVLYPGFEPATFLDVVPRYRVNHTILVPTMIRMVLDHPAAATADLSTLRGITCGGSPVSKELLLAARPVFGDVFRPTYGMAETYSCGLVLRPENQRPDGDADDIRRLGSAGKPHILVDVEVVADDGRPVPRDGDHGRRGARARRRRRRAATSAWPTRRRSPSRAGGCTPATSPRWTRTASSPSSTARRTSSSRAASTSPAARSRRCSCGTPTLRRPPSSACPHPQWGEAVHAVVVARPGVDPDTDAILAFCATQLASYKKPRTIEVRDELPISGTGKVLKQRAEARYRTAAGTAAAGASGWSAGGRGAGARSLAQPGQALSRPTGRDRGLAPADLRRGRPPGGPARRRAAGTGHRARRPRRAARDERARVPGDPGGGPAPRRHPRAAELPARGPRARLTSCAAAGARLLIHGPGYEVDGEGAGRRRQPAPRTDGARRQLRRGAGGPHRPRGVGPLDADTPCTILYTSGTTGRPKGAVLTNLSVYARCAVQRAGAAA